MNSSCLSKFRPRFAATLAGVDVSTALFFLYSVDTAAQLGQTSKTRQKPNFKSSWNWLIQFMTATVFIFLRIESKPCGIVHRIRDVGTFWFWYKTDIKIIYFVPLCLILLIVSDRSLFKYQKFWVQVNHCHHTQSKTKKRAQFCLGWRLVFLGFKTFSEI